MPERFSIAGYTDDDAADAVAVWNTVIWAGNAFPQEYPLDIGAGKAYFASQSFTGVARECASGLIAGVYVLHPDNTGRCGHIANASYAVAEEFRGMHLGEQLVRHSLAEAGKLGFRILKFNAVVASNTAALNLYRKLGFQQLGTIPAGFLNKSGYYEDIIPHFITLQK